MINLKRFAQYLKDSYEQWRRDQIHAGGLPNDATETAFARELRVTLGTWSKLTHAGTTPTLDTVAKLSAHPYIGVKVYDALGVARAMPHDPDLAAIAEDWPYLSLETKRAIIDLARSRAARPAHQAEVLQT